MLNTRIHYPLQISSILLLLGCSLILTMGCGDESATRCDTTTDCFQGEVCLDSVCLDRNSSSTNQATGANHTGEPNNDPSNNVTSNNAPSNNVTSNNDPSNNVTSNSIDPTLACIVNPFTASCDDPEERVNNTWNTPVFLNDRNHSGCPVGDELAAIDELYHGVLCHSEPADWFHLSQVRCRNRSFRVEITLTPKTDCASELIHLRVKNRTCDDDEVLCTLEEDGSFKIVIIIPASDAKTLAPLYIAVEPEPLEDSSKALQFEYDLRVVTSW